MKTITIPLELAEEIIEAIEAEREKYPEWLDKLKKLVEDAQIEDNIPEWMRKKDKELAKELRGEDIPKSRCCGRCDGIIDLCLSDMICELRNEADVMIDKMEKLRSDTRKKYGGG